MLIVCVVVCYGAAETMRLSVTLLRRVSNNYFKRYVERVLNENAPEPLWNPITGWVRHKPERWVYDKHRPWTADFKSYSRGEMTEGRKPKQPPVVPIKVWDVFVGDVVSTQPLM